ncbi:MAG: ribbon-helix-helix domain-containing protein [Alphaproteobacteria bacterium]
MIKKHSIVIAGHQTSISIEDEFWELFCQIVKDKGIPMAMQLEAIDDVRETNLSSAIRLFVLQDLKNKLNIF